MEARRVADLTEGAASARVGDYTAHLGSAIVHRQPGGAICIVPVHGQHRGRIFLPFADDDPRTAAAVLPRAAEIR